MESRGRRQACCGAHRGTWTSHLPGSHEGELQRLDSAADESKDASILWELVKTGDVDEHEDRMALDVIYSATPPEMVSTLAIKPTTNEA